MNSDQLHTDTTLPQKHYIAPASLSTQWFPVGAEIWDTACIAWVCVCSLETQRSRCLKVPTLTNGSWYLKNKLSFSSLGSKSQDTVFYELQRLSHEVKTLAAHDTKQGQLSSTSLICFSLPTPCLSLPSS